MNIFEEAQSILDLLYERGNDYCDVIESIHDLKSMLIRRIDSKDLEGLKNIVYYGIEFSVRNAVWVDESLELEIMNRLKALLKKLDTI